jgi:large subunit ribosomal protein L22
MAQAAAQKNKGRVQVQPVTVEAHARYIRISPRKMRLVTDVVRGTWALEALTQLQFTSKKGARFAITLIRSAIANAENNNKLKPQDLFIKSISCDSGPKLKRMTPKAQGRATEIRRPTTHIHVVLEERKSNRKVAHFDARRRPAKDEDLLKPSKPEGDEVEGHAADEGAGKRIQHSEVDKTGRQVKANKITQKRRLFNRKSGV